MDSDALHLTLRLSRVFGIAPFVRGIEYHVSRSIDICGKIGVCIISLYYFGAGITYPILTMNSILTLDWIKIASNISTVILALLGTFTASERIKRVALWMKHLNQIDLNIPCLEKPSKKMYYITLFYFVSSTMLHILEFVNYCRDIGKSIFVHLSKTIAYLIATLLELQLLALSGRALLTLKMINENLEQLNLNTFSGEERESAFTRETPRIAWRETGSAKNYISTHKAFENDLEFDLSESNMSFQIRQLTKYYLKICEFIRQTTTSEEYLMILMLIYHTLHLKFKILTWVSTVGSDWYSLIFPSIRSIIHSTALILSVESFHQTHIQMERTFLTINLLKCKKSGDKEVCNELDLFFRLFLLNKTTYSPLAICTMARPLIVKIFGGMVTYVVFIMT